MADVYNTIYKGEFCDDNGNDVFIEFKRRMSDSDPVPDPIDIEFAGNMDQPIYISYKDEGSYKLNPINGSECQVNIKAIGSFELSSLYTEDEREWLVIVSGAWDWFGWLIPDNASEPYDSKPYDVSVSATDAIDAIGDLPFLTEDRTKYTGFMSDLEVIWEIIKKTGLTYAVGIAINTFEETMSTSQCPLAQTYINMERFLDSDGRPFDCRTVLKSILQRWSARIHQFDGKWQIVNVMELCRGPVKMWNFLGGTTPTGSTMIGTELATGNQTRSRIPDGDTAFSSFSKAYGISTAYYQYGYPSSNIFNGDFNDWSPPLILPNGWTAAGGAVAATRTRPNPDTGLPTSDHYIEIISCPNNNSFVMSQHPVQVRAGQTVSVSYDLFAPAAYALSNSIPERFVQVLLMDNLGKYYVGTKGWSNTGGTYVIRYKPMEFNKQLTINFKIPAQQVDYQLTIGFRITERSGNQWQTFINNVTVSPDSAADQTKPPVGMYTRNILKSAQTYKADPILLLHADESNDQRTSQISIGSPTVITPPAGWARADITESVNIMFMVANSEMRLHQRPYRVFDAEFIGNGQLDINTIITIDLLPGKYMFLSGGFDLKRAVPSLRMAEVLISEPDYYAETEIEDYGSETKKDGQSVGSPGGVNPQPPVQIGSGTSLPTPEIIPFDFSVAPLTSIDMTINGREEFGNNPAIEVWNTIDADNETKYLDNFGIFKVKSDGVLQSLEFPDLNMDFAPSQTGYIILKSN